MSPHTDAGALLPCPFCGEKPDVRKRMDENLWDHNVVEWTAVECSECGFGFDCPPDAEKSAAELWNTRQAASHGSAGGEREAIARIIEPNGFHLLDELAKPESDGFPNRGEAENLASRQADLAYTKADAILALTPAQAPTNCDCGFSAKVCETNPCMRKKMAISGLNSEAEYPYCGTEGAAQAPSKEETFCHWLKGYLGAIKGRDELDAREANVVRNKLNEMLDGTSPIPSAERKCSYPKCECGDGFHICPEAGK